MITRCVLSSIVNPVDKSLYRLVRLSHGLPRLTHIVERQREPESEWETIAKIGHEADVTGTVTLPAGILHNLLSRIPDR